MKVHILRRSEKINTCKEYVDIIIRARIRSQLQKKKKSNNAFVSTKKRFKQKCCTGVSTKFNYFHAQRKRHNIIAVHALGWMVVAKSD